MWLNFFVTRSSRRALCQARRTSGLEAMEAGERFVGRFAEEFFAGGRPVGKGPVDDFSLPLCDTEEFPFGEGDLFDQGVLGVGVGAEVEFAFEEKVFELGLVFGGENGANGRQVVPYGVAETVCRPASVRGPVESCAFSRFAVS